MSAIVASRIGRLVLAALYCTALPLIFHPSSSHQPFLASALAPSSLPPASPRPMAYETASSIPNPPPPIEPFEPSAFDDALLSVFRWTLQRQSGVALPHIAGFDGMMAELHELRRTRGTEELERVSLRTMTALAGPVPFVHRALFADNEASPALLAWFAKQFLPFLVGDMTLTSTDASSDNLGTSSDDGSGENFLSDGGGLLVERCRVLEGSNCKGICAKMCKVPTQRFFAEKWGMPLSMEPNFETGQCQLRFGVTPMKLEDDPTIPLGCLCRCPTAGEGGCD